MKVTIEVECTPEEARRAMGLPDLTPIHDLYLSKIQDAMQGGAVGPEMLTSVMKSWAPMNEAGADFWRTMLAGGTKPAA